MTDLGAVQGQRLAPENPMNGRHGFVWIDGRPIDLGPNTAALAVSDAGLVVGTVAGADNSSHGAVWAITP